MARELDCRPDGLNEAGEYIIEWARTNHAEWFHRCQPPEEETPVKAAVTIAAAVAPAPARLPAPDPPRWRPAFQRLRGGLGLFGSGNVCQVTPSSVLSRACAATGSLPVSPSHTTSAIVSPPAGSHCKSSSGS